ncbi:MAG: transporter associated domain-containing protein [Caldilineaceae bacterium]
MSRIDVDTLAALLDIELPDENADTLGGMLYGLLGRVPQQGDSVTYDGWRFSVVLLDGRRIEQIAWNPSSRLTSRKKMLSCRSNRRGNGRYRASCRSQVLLTFRAARVGNRR